VPSKQEGLGDPKDSLDAFESRKIFAPAGNLKNSSVVKTKT
jgi:hypothetical protein